MEKHFMSKKEIDQAQIFNLLEFRHLTQKEACEILGLCERQIRRKLKEYKKTGFVALIHKGIGKTSNRKTPEIIEKKVLKLMTSKYIGFGPTLASEKLLSEENIRIDHDVLRRILIKHNIIASKPRKINLRVRREQKHHKGEFIQLDGSYHIWFGNEYNTLIVFIDDATKEVFCRFAPESTIGVTQTFLEYVKKYGRPLRLYTDKGKVFKVNYGKNKLAETQFCRILKELNIEITYANSPQAKGRVERVNRTLQDRLLKELKLKNVNNIQDANAMLDDFLKDFNQKFTVSPKSNENLFRSLEGYNLNSIFCYKYKRIINNDNTISFENRCLQLDKKQTTLIKPKVSIEIFKAFDGTISLWKSGHKLGFKEILKPIKQKIKKEKVYNNNPILRKAPLIHAWRDYEKLSSALKKTGHF